MIKVQFRVHILTRKIGRQAALVKPLPEVHKVFEDVSAAVLGNEAIIGRDDNSAGTMDEWDEISSKPGGVDAVTCDLDTLARK